MLAFAESYDSQWIAYIDTGYNNDSHQGNASKNFKTSSVPLYSIINGFYINRTGDYRLTIEYQPQKWFIEAAVVSLLTLLVSLGICIGSQLLYLKKLKTFVLSFLSTNKKKLLKG
jgi:hypothetical protein